jgi:hypothetical protein
MFGDNPLVEVCATVGDYADTRLRGSNDVSSGIGHWHIFRHRSNSILGTRHDTPPGTSTA